MKEMKLNIKKNLFKFCNAFIVKRCFKIFTPRRLFLFSSQGIQPKLRSIYTICNNILLLSIFIRVLNWARFDDSFISVDN